MSKSRNGMVVAHLVAVDDSFILGKRSRKEKRWNSKRDRQAFREDVHILLNR